MTQVRSIEMVLANRRLLVVDDDPALRELICTRLEIAGYESHRAVNGREALDRLTDLRPAGMLLDLNMPKLDGFEVLEAMSRRSDLSRIPVLVLTARNHSEDVRRAIALGASDYLAKPFETPRLLARVARLLRLAQIASQALERPAAGTDTFLL